MTYNAIIFDFNGTLLWDMDLHKEVWRDLVRRKAGTDFTEDEWIHGFVGRTNDEIWPRVLGRTLSPQESEELSEEKEVAYRDLLTAQPDRVRLVDGAQELFELCLSHNIAIAIATAAGQTNKEFYVETFDLHRWFDPHHIVYDDGTLPGKPHPALFSTAMKRLQAVPARSIVIEDGILGIQAARAAGAGKVYGMASTDDEVRKLSTVRLERILRSFYEVTLDDFE